MTTFGDILTHERLLTGMIEDFRQQGAIGLLYEARMRYSQLQIELLSRFAARHGMCVSMLIDRGLMEERLTKGEARLLKMMDGVVEHYRARADEDGFKEWLEEAGVTTLPRGAR